MVTDISEFIDLLKAKKQTGNGRIVVFAGAAISKKAPSNMPLANNLLDDTLNAILPAADSRLPHTLKGILKNDKQREEIRETITKASRERLLPLELFYDSIFEYTGKKVFDVFDCLKNGQPNENHRILIMLLEGGYIDQIITTNFDSLLEQSLSSKRLWGSSKFRKQIWKIHGDINNSDTMVAIFRSVGQMLFNDGMLTELKKCLGKSHVLFIGYGGTDLDLLPALVQAKMKSVFWIAYDKKEYDDKSNKKPWTTINKNCGGTRWIVGDLYDSALAKIEEEIFPNSQKKTDNQSSDSKQHRPNLAAGWLQFSENASAILQILYNTAMVSPSPQAQGIWDLIGEIADELLASPQTSVKGGDKLIRDLRSFRAEVHLQKGEIVEAKNHLTKIIPIRIDDQIQAKALLNAGAILTGLPGDENAEGAEYLFFEALRIANGLPKQEAGRLSLQGRCHANLAILRIRQNRPYETSRHYESAARLFKEEGSLLKYIHLSINQARHFMHLGDTANVLKCFFRAEQEHNLMSSSNDQLGNALGELEQEIKKAGVDIVELRSQFTAGNLDINP